MLACGVRHHTLKQGLYNAVLISRRRLQVQRALANTSKRHFSSEAQFGTIYAGRHSTISDLIQQVESIPPGAGRNGILLLALSPAYAHHARDQNLPLTVATKLQHSGDLTSVTAVVDGLLDRSGNNSNACEGIAYVLQENLSFLPGEPLRKSAQRPGSISFELQKAVQQQQWKLQLPLGQTIFSTGLTSTLIIRKHAGQQLEQEDYFETLTCKLSEAENALQIDFPLTQLTSYRTVGQSMGNIVRTLSNDDRDEEPASSNLEKAVAAYFDAISAGPEPVNVWALIIPKKILLQGRIDELANKLVLDTAALERLWTSKQAGHVDIRSFLQHQARLVKVLSGGGGWGKKAGLLSLDPDLEYSTRELRDDFGWQFDFDEHEDDTSTSVGKSIDQALGASVEEGDGIVFMISPVGSRPQPSNLASSMLAFGASEPSNSVQSSAEDTVQIEQNFFGICSETGIGLQIHENGQLINKTKLEVPGLRLKSG